MNLNKTPFKPIYKWLLLSALSLIMTACHIERIPNKESKMSEPVKFYIGQSGAELTGDKPNGNIDKQPMGASFPKVSWSPNKPGILRFEHGKYSFEIPNAYTVMGYEDLTLFPADKMQHFTTAFGLERSMTHTEARDWILGYLRGLEAKGWRVATHRDSGRLDYKQRWQYALKNQGSFSYPPPLNYTPTLEQWMQADWGWMLYADGVWIHFYYFRDPERMNPQGEGGYFMNIDFDSELDQLRESVYSKERYKKTLEDSGDPIKKSDEMAPRWKEFLPDVFTYFKKSRADDEKRLRKEGWKIDETYQDPPIPEEFLRDPQTRLEYGVKPTATVGGICPLTGFWRCIHPDLKPTEIYILKGDKMPGQSYAQMGVKNPETIYWEWVKPAPKPQT